MMTRRSALLTTGVALGVAARAAQAAPAAGRLKQSVARWCYAKIPLEDLCRQAAEIGCKGMDLVEPPDWPTCRKFGLTPAMTTGKAKIPDGFNRKENHDRLETELKETIAAAAEAKG